VRSAEGTDPYLILSICEGALSTSEFAAAKARLLSDS